MRPSVRSITASSQTTASGTWTRTTTCSSQCTTSTPMTMLTSTIAWCTPCVERARRAHSSTPDDVISHLILAQVLSLIITISIPSMAHSPWFDLSLLPLLFLPVLLRLLPPPRAVPWARQPDRHGKSALLRRHWEWGRLRRLHFPHRLWAQPPDLGELNDSSVPFSFMIPSSDQDVGDVTLGKMLTEAHRGQVDYCEPEGMSVSQSSSSVRFDGSGQPDGERNVDQSVNFGVTRNTLSAHSNFSEDIQIEKMVDRSGQPDERNSSKAQIRTLLEEQKQTVLAECHARVITNSKQLTQKKSADSYKDNCGDRNWNFVKLINKVLQKWRNYGNSRVLPSIRSRDENSSRTRTLFWNYQAEYRNCKMK